MPIDVLEPDLQVSDSESSFKSRASEEAENAPESTETEPSAEPVEDDAGEESAPSTDEEETGEDSADEPPKKSKGVQKRIDELTRAKYEAEREREIARQELERYRREAEQQKAQPATGDNEPRFEDFSSYDDYVKAIAKHSALKEVNAIKAQQAQETEARKAEEMKRAFDEKAAKARSKYDDFDTIALSPIVPYTPVMAQLVAESDIAGDLAYYLGKNLDEAKRLSQLSPVDAAKQLGRLEAKLSEAPKPKKITQAPPPIKTVAGNEKVSKDPSKMSMAEYMEWRQPKKK
jgi:hypothetical protein